MFEFLLFTANAEVARRAAAAGIDAIVVDWERQDKHRRQLGADTQINQDTTEDLARVREVGGVRVIVRVNGGCGMRTREDIEQALSLGADEILLPMVESPGQVEWCLSQVRGRAEVGILIETVAAVACARELGAFPLRRVYVGLNDLMIQRGTPSIFSALVDGTLDAIRPHIKQAFGFGGLTLPERGRPVPCRLLMGELMRLSASHAFLRRSFLADTAAVEMGDAVKEMRAGLAAAGSRSAVQAARDRKELEAIVPLRAVVGISPRLRQPRSRSVLPYR